MLKSNVYVHVLCDVFQENIISDFDNMTFGILFLAIVFGESFEDPNLMSEIACVFLRSGGS